MTLRILSGALYLDLIWYGCEINSIPLMFWKTICLIDAALDNIKLDKSRMSVAHMVNSWAVMRQMCRGFPSNFGMLLALDGFVLAIKKPTTKSLGEKDVAPYFNRKGYYALIAQVGVDSGARLVFTAV
jgi:hypothetical protein